MTLDLQTGKWLTSCAGWQQQAVTRQAQVCLQCVTYHTRTGSQRKQYGGRFESCVRKGRWSPSRRAYFVRDPDRPTDGNLAAASTMNCVSTWNL